MNKYNVRCKLILPSHKHIDQIDCQKFFKFLIFFKDPSLSEGILESNEKTCWNF